MKSQDLLIEIGQFLEHIRGFVRNDLGCECPEEVFDQVRVLRNEASPGPTTLSLIIGETLLVEFASTEELAPIANVIDRLLLSGVTYRDSTGLNRFRLILCGKITDDEKTIIAGEQKRYDKKVHVHYIE
ncbi:MAG: hypothetical protein ABIC40_08955 [bacterium]